VHSQLQTGNDKLFCSAKVAQSLAAVKELKEWCQLLYSPD